jgi:hypothetical protein
VQSDFFAFDFARIAGHQSGFFEYWLEARIKFYQCAGDTVAHCTCLSGFATAIDVYQNIKRRELIGEDERLAHHHAAGFAREENIYRLVVHDDVALARF